jgi:hypothetical protein
VTCNQITSHSPEILNKPANAADRSRGFVLWRLVQDFPLITITANVFEDTVLPSSLTVHDPENPRSDPLESHGMTLIYIQAILVTVVHVRPMRQLPRFLPTAEHESTEFLPVAHRTSSPFARWGKRNLIATVKPRGFLQIYFPKIVFEEDFQAILLLPDHEYLQIACPVV